MTTFGAPRGAFGTASGQEEGKDVVKYNESQVFLAYLHIE